MSEPTHEQAQLLLQVYDLRREERLRTARTWFLQNFWAETMEEIEQIAPQGSDENAYMRQVASYWDMVCMLMNQGLLHREQFFTTNGEAYMVWQRFKPLAGIFRQMYKNPHFFEEMEMAAAAKEKHAKETAPGYLEVMQGFVQQAREAARAARKPKKAAGKKAKKKAVKQAKKKAKKKSGKKRKR